MMLFMKGGKQKHLLLYRQRFIYRGESEAFAKHTKYAYTEYAKHPFKHALFACHLSLLRRLPRRLAL